MLTLIITYNEFGQRLSAQSCENTLATYVYDAVTHNLKYMTYGNSQKIAYSYDKLDRLVSKEYTQEMLFTYYFYDHLGNVIEEHYVCADVIDKSYHYEYDELGMLVPGYISENGIILEQSEHEYDSKGRDSKYNYESDDLSYGLNYKYYENSEGARLGSVNQDYNGNSEITNV